MSNMKRERILEIISDLSKSQGLYGRLLRDIELDPTILDTLEEQNFKDSLDLILFIECQEVKRHGRKNYKIKQNIRNSN